MSELKYTEREMKKILDNLVQDSKEPVEIVFIEFDKSVKSKWGDFDKGDQILVEKDRRGWYGYCPSLDAFDIPTYFNPECVKKEYNFGHKGILFY